MPKEHVDVLIVGAGISGIGAAWRVRGHFRGKARKVLVRIDELQPQWLGALRRDRVSENGVECGIDDFGALGVRGNDAQRARVRGCVHGEHH